MRERAYEAGVKEPVRGDRRGKQEPQIVREKEGRQRGDDPAEREERKEREKQPRQPDTQQVVPELRVIGKLPGNPERCREDREGDDRRNAAEDQTAQQIAALAA